MYTYVKERRFGTVEGELKQHEALAKLYPNSVNTMRVVTLLTGSEARGWKANCVYAVLKIGNGGKFVDNLENGGMFCPVNLETGELTAVGHTSSLETVEAHLSRASACRATVFPLPRRAVELCKKAALVEPACALWAGTCASRRRAPPLWRATTIRATTSGSSRSIPLDRTGPLALL